jgi:hypothetical protein
MTSTAAERIGVRALSELAAARSAGHQSLVLHTPDGIWVCSRNGVCADAWQPQLSKIPDLRTQTERREREVELAPWRRQWPLVPTFQAGGLEVGRIVA